MDQPAAEQLDPRWDHQPAQERVHLQALQPDRQQEPVAPLGFRLDQWQARSHPLVPHQWRAQHHLLAGHHPQVQIRPCLPRLPVQR